MTLSLVYGSSAVFMALLLRSPPWGSDSAAPCEGRWRQGGSHPWCGPETHLPPGDRPGTHCAGAGSVPRATLPGLSVWVSFPELMCPESGVDANSSGGHPAFSPPHC